MKATNLIKKRESLISEIKENWSKINMFNSIEPNAKRLFDIDKLYEQIIKDSNELIQVKVAIQAVNMGLKKMSDLPEDSIYPIIYSLQQLKEQKVKLMSLNTKGDDVVITKSKAALYVKDIEEEMKRLQVHIDEFNLETEFDIAA